MPPQGIKEECCWTAATLGGHVSPTTTQEGSSQCPECDFVCYQGESSIQHCIGDTVTPVDVEYSAEHASVGTV